MIRNPEQSELEDSTFDRHTSEKEFLGTKKLGCDYRKIAQRWITSMAASRCFDRDGQKRLTKGIT